MIDKELMRARILHNSDAWASTWEVDELAKAVDYVVVWHPYPNEKPNDDRYVMVTFENKGERFVTMAWYDNHVKCFHFVGEYMANKPVDIVAWAELPKPYEPSEGNV